MRSPRGALVRNASAWTLDEGESYCDSISDDRVWPRKFSSVDTAVSPSVPIRKAGSLSPITFGRSPLWLL